MSIKFYKDGDGYLMATGECPKGFEGVVYVVWTGEPGKLKEGVRTAGQLKQLEEVHGVDRDWLDAFAEVAGPAEKAEAKRVARAAAQRKSSMDEFIAHCAAGTDFVTAAAASGVMEPEETEETEEVELPEGYETFHSGLVAFCMAIGFVIYLLIEQVS